MRYGIFSDVHSNLEALQAVLAALQREHIDRYLCAGDIVGYAADPLACLETVQGLGAEVIAGNHDWACAEKITVDSFNTYAKAGVMHNSRQLSADDKRYLAGLPLTFEHADCTAVHGSLQDPAEFDYVYDAASAAECFRHLAGLVCFFGHTHVAGFFVKHGNGMIENKPVSRIRFDRSKQYLVNPGSVGQPRDGDWRASYCILDTERQEAVIRRQEYDVNFCRAKIVDAGLPRILGDRLFEGR